MNVVSAGVLNRCSASCNCGWVTQFLRNKLTMLLYIWIMDTPRVMLYRGLRSGTREEFDLRGFHTEKLEARGDNYGYCSLVALVNLFSIQNG